MRITRNMAIVLVVVLLVLAACAKPVTPTTLPVAPPVIAVQGPNEVWVKGREFRPAVITVPVGTEITWTSKDAELHTATSDSGLFNGTLGPGGSFSYTFAERGTFSYYCQQRSEMAGTIYVE